MKYFLLRALIVCGCAYIIVVILASIRLYQTLKEATVALKMYKPEIYRNSIFGDVWGEKSLFQKLFIVVWSCSTPITNIATLYTLYRYPNEFMTSFCSYCEEDTQKAMQEALIKERKC